MQPSTIFAPCQGCGESPLSLGPNQGYRCKCHRAADPRIRHVIGYAVRGDGRSYGGGMADYSDSDIMQALYTIDRGEHVAISRLRAELDARGVRIPWGAPR